MRQLVISPSSKGRLIEVPGPTLRSNGILVRLAYSAVSVGTERAAAKASHQSLLEKAKSRPEQVKQVIKKIQADGIKSSLGLVQGALEKWQGSGYSCAGTVVAVGRDVAEFRVGDRVVCAGGTAQHAEYVSVPRRLAAKVPDGVSLDQAAFSTIGAIAMHGFRLAQLNLSEHVAVVGLGIIGQLTCQIAAASGLNVTAVDVKADTVDRALKVSGAHHGIVLGNGSEIELSKQITNGRGFDAVLICAATASNDPIQMAEEITRDKGAIVIVGDVGLALKRPGMFEKELRVMVSRSYGPGRYDPEYEDRGNDYPYGFVRWTEQRNLESFLNLIERGKLQVGPLITHTFPFDQVEKAFEVVVTGEGGPVGILLEYPQESEPPAKIVKLTQPQPVAAASGKAGIAFLGAGSFSRTVLLPAIMETSGVNPVAVLSSSGVSATQLAQKYGFGRVSTDSQDVLGDDKVKAIFVVTRHDSHASYVMSALKAGKSVFVEKPLATTVEDTLAICEVQRETAGMVMVGFNRRFAPQTTKLKKFFGTQHGPMVITVRVNVGPLAKHWSLDANDGGGRIIGEGCHFVDLIQAIAGSPIVKVFAQSLPVVGERLEENICATFTMADGSVASLNYNGVGDGTHPKEFIEVFADGKVAVINDFRELTLVGSGKSTTEKSKQDKGHKTEISLFVDALNQGKPCPLPFEESVSATLATFAILESCRTGQPIEIGSVEV